MIIHEIRRVPLGQTGPSPGSICNRFKQYVNHWPSPRVAAMSTNTCGCDDPDCKSVSGAPASRRHLHTRISAISAPSALAGRWSCSPRPTASERPEWALLSDCVARRRQPAQVPTGTEPMISSPQKRHGVTHHLRFGLCGPTVPPENCHDVVTSRVRHPLDSLRRLQTIIAGRFGLRDIRQPAGTLPHGP